jgi:hypothetical protein
MKKIVQNSAELKEEKKIFILEAVKEILTKGKLEEAACLSEKKARSSAKFEKGDCVLFVLLLCIFRRLSYINLFEKIFSHLLDFGVFGSNGNVNTTSLTSARDRLLPSALFEIKEIKLNECSFFPFPILLRLKAIQQPNPRRTFNFYSTCLRKKNPVSA